MKTLITTLALTLASTVAMAADAVYDVPPAPVAEEAAPFSWTGFNVGVQAGYGWNNNDISIPGVGLGGLAIAADFDGALVGGFVGYNYQLQNNWVVGLEGDFEASFADETFEIAPGAGVEVGMDWQGSVRGRVGYAFDRALVYGTAGWAIGRGYAEVPAAGFESKETFNGYTVGAGVDYAFTDMVFGRVEYRYTDFGDKDFGFGPGAVNAEVDQHAIRVGLGVKF